MASHRLALALLAALSVAGDDDDPPAEVQNTDIEGMVALYHPTSGLITLRDLGHQAPDEVVVLVDTDCEAEPEGDDWDSQWSWRDQDRDVFSFGPGGRLSVHAVADDGTAFTHPCKYMVVASCYARHYDDWDRLVPASHGGYDPYGTSKEALRSLEAWTDGKNCVRARIATVRGKTVVVSGNESRFRE